MAVARSNAVSDFRQARRRAGLEQLVSRITGKSPELLSFEEVRRKLRASSMVDRGLQDIPLDAIVGSVGRYRDFTRSFLPLSDEDQDRWASVKVAQVTQGVPPISVYKIGDAYFVHDGNHRVSIARQMGSKTIEAYVTEVQTSVPLEANVQPDDLIVKAEYAEFLEKTRLDRLRTESDLSLTAAGKYPLLLEHINVRRYYMGLEQQRDIPYEQAVLSWHDDIYQPIARLIERSGLLYDFPNRTTADLYLWLTEHRARIENALEMKVKTTRAAADLKGYSPDAGVSFGLARVLKVGDAPESPLMKEQVQRLAEGAEAGQHDHLFETILVPFSRNESSWAALDQAFTVAQRESGHIRGLLSLSNEAEAETLFVQEFQEAFRRRSDAAYVSSRLILETGSMAEAVFELARWVDLIVLVAPQGKPREKGLQKLIQSVPGPILLLPHRATALRQALLVYDGGRASQASLAAAGYIARCWQTELTVMISPAGGADPVAIEEQAATYLTEYGAGATFVSAAGAQPEATFQAIAGGQFDLLLWGGSGKSALEMLAATDANGEPVMRLPVLLCD